VPSLLKLEESHEWNDFRSTNALKVRILSPEAFADLVRQSSGPPGSGLPPPGDEAPDA
jgi:hypothetical protein